MDFIKQKQETLSDQLPYYSFDINSEAIWLKDGSATLSLKVIPKDCSHLTDEEMETLRAGLTPVLNHLPDGSVMQALLIRERSTISRDQAYQRWLNSHTGRAPDQAERQLLFEARNGMIEQEFNQGNFLQTRCYLTLRILPEHEPKPGKAMGPFSHLGFRFLGKSAARRSRDQILKDLKSSLENLSMGLEALGFEVVSVPHDERMQIIYEWLNPERAQAIPTLIFDADSSISDQVSLTDLVEDRSGISLGRNHLEITSLKSLPEFSVPAALQTLACANNPFSMLLTIYVLPQTQERERLLRKQRIAQGMASGNAVRNIMAEAQLRDIEDTLGALISSGEKLFGVSFHITGIKETQ